jgi:hypothetical protein
VSAFLPGVCFRLWPVSGSAAHRLERAPWSAVATPSGRRRPPGTGESWLDRSVSSQHRLDRARRGYSSAAEPHIADRMPFLRISTEEEALHRQPHFSQGPPPSSSKTTPVTPQLSRASARGRGWRTSPTPQGPRLLGLRHYLGTPVL